MNGLGRGPEVWNQAGVVVVPGALSIVTGSG